LLTALLLITTEIGKEIKVMKLLKTTKGVEDVHLVYGAYDMVAKIRTESMDELQEIVTNRLMISKEIRSSTTLMIIPEKPKVVVLTEENPKILA
jgi:DNA-binding Lrp family transcriptional regulator